VIIEDDEPTSTKAKVDTEIDTVRGAEIDGMDSTLDPASELAAPVNTSGVDKWYDMDENHYIDGAELLQNLGLGEQEVSTSPPRDQPHPFYDPSKLPHDQVSQGGSDRVSHQSSKELDPRTLPAPLTQDDFAKNTKIAMYAKVYSKSN
jgi:hypothetical protein